MKKKLISFIVCILLLTACGTSYKTIDSNAAMDLIEDTILRKSLEEMKSQNYFKCIVCTSSGFTRTAYSFAENRPFELIPKEKLEKLLENANI